MEGPAPDPLLPSLQRLRALFDAALALPHAEREPFVRREAADDHALAEQALALLHEVEVARTDDLQVAVHAELAAAQTAAIPTAAPQPAANVQSTATDALWRRLAAAPRLDPERYALEGEVGRGGMGAVLRIHDRHLNRRLAMKVLKQQEVLDELDQKHARQLLGRFLEEAQITSQLDHPGVVPVHELGLDQDGRVFFTMQLVRGRTAGEVFAEARAGAGGWTITRALEVVLKVCDTMAFAHDKGVLHRDLKPANVMVGRFGEVYVMDWGLARLAHVDGGGADDVPLATARQQDVGEGQDADVATQHRQQLGTPAYMPPEQADGEAVDARADIYAIGAMLYELLGGSPPYVVPGQRLSPYEMLGAVRRGPPQRLEQLDPSVPPELVAITEKAMARDRAQRYAAVGELAADLRAFLDQRAVGAYRTGALVELRLWVRRNRALAASLAAAVVILVAGVFLVTRATLRSQQATALAEFTEVQRLMADGAWEPAIAACDRALASGYPDRFAIAIAKSEALDSISRSEAAAVTRFDAADLTSSQLARLWLWRADIETNWMTDPEPGLALLRRARELGSLGTADDLYARAMLTADLRTAWGLVQQARVRDPAHRPSVRLALALSLLCGTPQDTRNVLDQYRLLYPNDPVLPLLSAASLLLDEGRIDPSRVDAVLAASLENDEGDTHVADALQELVTFVVGKREELATKGRSSVDPAQLFRLVPKVLLVSGDIGGSHVVLHPSFARFAAELQRLAGAIMVGQDVGRSIDRLSPWFEDAFLELCRAAWLSVSDVEGALAAFDRAKNMRSIAPRFIGSDGFAMFRLRLHKDLLAHLQSRQWQQNGGTDAAWAARCRTWLDEVLARPDVPEDLLHAATDAALAIDPQLGLELALRRLRHLPEEGQARFHLAASLFRCGAFVWSRRLWAEFAAEDPTSSIWPGNVAACEQRLLELPEIQRLIAERGGK